MSCKSNGKAIAVGFTDQQLSPHAGSALFWGWLRPLDWCKTLTAALPHALPLSNNKLLPLEKALAFMHGLWCDARKLKHVSHLRRDPLVPELFGITRVPSQLVRTRFFQGFTSAGVNLCCFRPRWHGGLHRLPSTKDGSTLDLDSTRLLHKDGEQEGAKSGYTKQGIKNPASIRSWRCWPKCGWWRNPGCAPATPLAATTSTPSSWTCETTCPATSGSRACARIPVAVCPNCWRCGKS